MSGDDELRARFASLRTQNDMRMPSFETMLARGEMGRRRRLFPRIVAAGVFMCSILVFILWVALGSNPTELPSAALLNWKSPTQFLLSTPDQPLLRTVPRVGEVTGVLPSSPAGAIPITREKSQSHEAVS